MADAALRRKLVDAYLPYARAYCTDPANVVLEIKVQSRHVIASLRMGGPDRVRILRDRELRGGLLSAFRDLSLACDPTREALLDLDPE